jgi:hypothetical protein
MIILLFGSVSAQRARVKQLLWAFVKDPPAKQRRFVLHVLSYLVWIFVSDFLYFYFISGSGY